jgi:hypothetical protein
MNIILRTLNNQQIPITYLHFNNQNGGYLESTGNGINENTEYYVDFLRIKITTTNLASHHNRFNFGLTERLD